MEEEDFFVGAGSSPGGIPVSRTVATNTPEKMTKAEKKSWWDEFWSAVQFWKKTPESMALGIKPKNGWKAPKSALRTPANYMPAGTIRWRGKLWPAVWLNGTRWRVNPESESGFHYYPPEFDSKGNMVEAPRFERSSNGWDPFIELVKGAGTAAAGLFAAKAAGQAGFQRGAVAGYQLGRMQGVQQMMGPHVNIDPID